MRRWGALVGGLLVLVPGAIALAQDADPPRAILVDEPRVGRTAPEVVAPYVTREGPGPADQPFRLSAELGRVVVLVFRASDSLLVSLTQAPDSVLAGAVVAVPVLEVDQAILLSWAAGLDTPYKFLPDSEGRIHRAFGVRDRGGSGAVAWVINPLGAVEAKVEHLDPDGKDGLGPLHRAILRAGGR